MRVGLVIYGSLETLSGGYHYDRRLVEHLHACGDTVEVVSMPWKHYPAHLAHHFDPSWQRRLASLDVDVLLQDEFNHPSLAWMNASLKEKVHYPILSIVHHLRGSESHSRLVEPVYRAVEKQYLRSVDGFVFNSQTTRKVVEGILEAEVKGVVATPGGDRLGEGLSEVEIRARLEVETPLRLLFVGNIIPRKGLDTLIEALARIKAVDWSLRVAGPVEVDPGYTSLVKRLVRNLGLGEQVTFLGRVEEDILKEEMRRAHLLVVPSQYEGFGIVYLEAMAFGLPPIASSAGAASEIIQSGKNGLIVQPGDPLHLAERIADLFHDRQKLLEMSLAARERFEQYPGWDTSMATVRQYLLNWSQEAG